MRSIRFGMLAITMVAVCAAGPLMDAPLMSAPILGAWGAGAPQSTVRSLADSNWRGAVGYTAKGNSPAELRFITKDGKLVGIVTYDGAEETMAITLTAPSGIQMKGVSFRDLNGNNPQFNLDTFTGEISKDGGTISGTGIDTGGTRSKFEFHRTYAHFWKMVGTSR